MSNARTDGKRGTSARQGKRKSKQTSPMAVVVCSFDHASHLTLGGWWLCHPAKLARLVTAHISFHSRHVCFVVNYSRQRQIQHEVCECIAKEQNNACELYINLQQEIFRCCPVAVCMSKRQAADLWWDR